MSAEITLFHVTRSANKEAILAGGFRDGEGTYMTDRMLSGVWLSDRPLGAEEGAHGDAILKITFSPDTDLSLFELGEEMLSEGGEWVPDNKGYREWLIPAELINSRAKVSVFDGEFYDDRFPPQAP